MTLPGEEFLTLNGAASIASRPLLHALLRGRFYQVQLCPDLPELAAANDFDLLVVEPELTSRYSETVRLQKELRGVLMSVDLVVTSQAHFDERSRIPGTLEYGAHREGRVLHDSL
jgi:hypothetical protein